MAPVSWGALTSVAAPASAATVAVIGAGIARARSTTTRRPDQKADDEGHRARHDRQIQSLKHQPGQTGEHTHDHEQSDDLMGIEFAQLD